ncbi:C-type lectin domain family 6 member A-like [Melanerpes formicivorus]|uniref:C-type lectin domain family 6 member A-like n=1 Tax=Melanerpes formicivorus TaxID=211600 RepID=UPI00358FBF3B
MSCRGTVRHGAAGPTEERSWSWLTPWFFLGFVLAIKTAFVTICLVVFLHGNYGQCQTLLQNAPEWCCVPSASAGNREKWTCCPDGWRPFQEKCYYLSSDKMSWAESEQNCTGMGAHLVVINSKAEQEFLSSVAKGISTKDYEAKYYIGLTAYENSQWLRVDQTPYKAADTCRLGVNQDDLSCTIELKWAPVVICTCDIVCQAQSVFCLWDSLVYTIILQRLLAHPGRLPDQLIFRHVGTASSCAFKSSCLK